MKKRFTVVLAAIANGKKLKLFAVIKGVRPIAELNQSQVTKSPNGWMNENLTIEWIDRVWAT